MVTTSVTGVSGTGALSASASEEAVWSLAEEQSVHGESVRAWRRNGAPGAPRLVLVHGFEENWDSWLRLGHLLPGYDLTCLDLPWRANNGYRWVHTGSSVTWLTRALDMLEERPDVLVGHSFGAVTVLDLLAAGQAHGVRGAALVAPIYRPHDVATDPQFFGEAIARSRRVLRDGMEVALGERAGRMSPQLLDRLFRTIVSRVEPHGFLNLYSTVARNAAQSLDAVDLPVLIVSGTHDPSAPPAAVEELTRRLPQSYVHQSAELSHFCQLQQPDVVATTIANFLMQQGITHHNQSHDTTHETTMEAISA